MVAWVLHHFLDGLRPRRMRPKHAHTHAPDWRRHRQVLSWASTWWSDCDAILTMLIAAVTADRETDPREEQVLHAIVERSHKLRGLSRDSLERRVERANRRLGVSHSPDMRLKDRAKILNARRWRTLEKATRSFRHVRKRRVAILLEALDLLYADQVLLPSEMEFERELILLLEPISDKATWRDEADRCVALIDLKYKGELLNPSEEPRFDSGAESSEKQRAFFTILAAAILVDGDEDPQEKAELEALMRRTRTLSRLREHAREDLKREIVPRLKRCFEPGSSNRWDRVVEACTMLKALESSNPGICQTVFLHALDLMQADHKYRDAEKELTAKLEEEFGGLLKMKAVDVLELLNVKNFL
jgi:endonuclease III